MKGREKKVDETLVLKAKRDVCNELIASYRGLKINTLEVLSGDIRWTFVINRFVIEITPHNSLVFVTCIFPRRFQHRS